jgi:hypothetical protein
MNKVVLLAATFVLSTGVMLGQSSPTAIDNERPNAAPDQMQRDTTQSTPGIVPHQPPETTANPNRTGTMPDTTLPSTTIDDQQPGNSTTGSPSSTMGTTGSTPATDQSTTGNQSGNLPDGDNPQKPKSDSTQPHGTYSSGSSNPGSSANGASSNDMSGTSPKADSTTDSANPQTTTPHIATHAPDAGTEMNPAALEISAAEKVRN